MKNLILTLLIITSSVAYSQKQTVFIKNGSILKGTVIENNSNYQIKTKGGNVFTIERNQVDSITSKRKKFNDKGYSLGFSQTIMVGKINSTIYSNSPGISAGTYMYEYKINNNYFFNNHFAFGIGVGLILGEFGRDYGDKVIYATTSEYYSLHKQKHGFREILIPVTLDAKFVFFNTKISPTIISSNGYSFSVNQIWGGANSTTTMGLTFRIKNKTNINWGAGVRIQEQRVYVYSSLPTYRGWETTPKLGITIFGVTNLHVNF